MPSDRDVMRAVDLIGGFKPYHGTLPDYKIASKFTAPDSYGNFLRRVRKEDYCLLCFMFFCCCAIVLLLFVIFTYPPFCNILIPNVRQMRVKPTHTALQYFAFVTSARAGPVLLSGLSKHLR